MLKRSLPLTGTGDETRDFTYVLDLVQGLIKAAYYENAIGKAFNLASGSETKIKDMIAMVNAATGNQIPITQYNYNYRLDQECVLLTIVFMSFSQSTLVDHTVSWVT